MKRKLINVLLALVLALSLSVITAVPAAAAPATLNVVPFTLKTGGDGTATWETAQHHTGSYSVELYTGTTSDVSYGGVNIPPIAPIPLQSLTADPSYWVYEPTVVTDRHPYVNIILDLDGNLATTTDIDCLEGVGSRTIAGGQPPAATWTEMKERVGYYDGDQSMGASGYIVSAPGTLAQWKAYMATHYANAKVIKVQLMFGMWADASIGPVYVDDVNINGTTYYGLIQDAIDTVSAGDTINVAAGTYVGDLAIPADKTNLELVGAAGATIKEVATTDRGLFPAGLPNIGILASGVKIHGFTIQSPDPVSTNWSCGIVIGAAGAAPIIGAADVPNVEIYNNAFQVANSNNVTDTAFCVGIQTSHKNDVPGLDVSGLNIHDNTFTHLGAGTVGYEGIYINPDEGAGTVNITNNQFTGYLARGITTERSNTTISGNSLITDVSTTVTTTRGIRLISWATPPDAQDAVTITGNTIKGSATGKGFAQGIVMGVTDGTDQTLTNISVTQNTVQMNVTGIKVISSADGVTVNYNDINGNTTYGAENTNTANTLNALYNYWGDASGPTITTNERGAGDKVSAYVDYEPWLHTTQATVYPSGVRYYGYNLVELLQRAGTSSLRPLLLMPRLIPGVNTGSWVLTFLWLLEPTLTTSMGQLRAGLP
jgi:hypothetical protein